MPDNKRLSGLGLFLSVFPYYDPGNIPTPRRIAKHCTLLLRSLPDLYPWQRKTAGGLGRHADAGLLGHHGVGSGLAMYYLYKKQIFIKV